MCKNTLRYFCVKILKWHLKRNGGSTYFFLNKGDLPKKQAPRNIIDNQERYKKEGGQTTKNPPQINKTWSKASLIYF